jgi:hypothetical protein
MKRIILSALAALFLCLGAMGQQVVTKLPNSLPFGLNAEKIFVISNELLVTKRGDDFALVWVDYNKRTKEFALESEGAMTRTEAKALIEEYKARAILSYRRDSAKIEGITTVIDSLK